jgi:PAS domain S-box-containing protein
VVQSDDAGSPGQHPTEDAKASVLLVDDHAPNLLALEGVLSRLGHRMVRAASGEEALKHLLAGDFALILMDVQMPRMNGFETAELIKSHLRLASIPIIFITAMSRDAAQIFQGYEHGAVDYLLKPFDPHILRSKAAVFIDLYLKTAKIKEQANLLRQQEIAILEQNNEQRYRRLAECLPVSMWAAAPDGRVYYSNRTWCDYSGQKVDEVTTLTNHEVVHEDDIDHVRASWAESRRAGSAFEMEYRLRRHVDGAYRWHLGRGVAERDDHGQIEGWIVTAIDIDDQKNATEARARLLELEKDAREKADTANRTKDEFLATLSHEIRTPLNAILGWAQLLRSGGLDEAASAKALEIIERNAQAQGRVIEDLLDVQRIVTGKTRLVVTVLDLRTIINAAAESIGPAAAAKGVRISLELENLAPVNGDAGRLQQVVSNLLSNAVKFTPQNGQVKVALSQVESGVEIRVSDDGAGIRRDFLPHVFERFRQGDSTTTRTQGGLGLGLAIVHHLVGLHGGTVRAESDGPGKGTVFAVRLPVRRSSERLRATGADTVAIPPNLDGIEVLVVDDERDARELLRAVLAKCGATVSVAASAGEALESLSMRMPHVVVSDIGMPGEDGYSLIKKMSAYAALQGKVRPIAVAVTAFASTEDRERALRTGFQAHLAKPVDPAELVLSIASLLSPGSHTRAGQGHG